MNRESFIFYRSFFEAIKPLENPTDKLALFEAIFEYALNGVDLTEKLTGFSKSIFTLIKPQISANNYRYINGCKGAEYGHLGGRPRKEKAENEKPLKTPRKPLDNPQENPKETPNVNENDNDIIKKIKPNGLIKEKTQIQDLEKPKKEKFKIPTLEEIKTYATETRLFCNCEKFLDHFTANGWKQSNGNAIKDWRAALRNWNRNEPKFASPDELKTRQEALQALTPKQETEIEKIRRKIIEEQGLKGSEIISFQNRFSRLEKGKSGFFLVANHPHDFEVLSSKYADLLRKYSIKVVIGYNGLDEGKSLIN